MTNITPGLLNVKSQLLSVLGASLLSSIGSLSQHLAPLFAVVVVADGRATVIQAAWALSARSMGELIATITLPILRVTSLGRLAACGALLFLMVAFSLAALRGLTPLLLGFAIVGMCSGILKYLGTLSVSAHQNRTFAFSLRLSLVLIVAGGIVVLLVATDSVSTFSGLLWCLVALLAPLSLLALLLYKPEQLVSKSHPDSTERNAVGVVWLSLIFLFFVGTSGFMSLVGLQAIERGIAQNDSFWAIGSMKVVAGAWLLMCAFRLVKKSHEKIRARDIGLLIAAMWCVYFSVSVVQFVLAFLFLEIALNAYGARLQALVVGKTPALSSRWLNAAILLGCTCGPLLYTSAIAAGLEISFLAMASLSISVPWLIQNSPIPSVAGRPALSTS